MTKSKKILKLIDIIIEKKINKLLLSERINKIIDKKIKLLVENNNNIINKHVDENYENYEKKTFSKNNTINDILNNIAIENIKPNINVQTVNETGNINTVHGAPVPQELNNVFNKNYSNMLSKMKKSADIVRKSKLSNS